MGNLCFIDNITHKSQLIQSKKLCVKCKDKFIPSYGGFSERTSCRNHLYDDNIYVNIVIRKKTTDRGIVFILYIKMIKFTFFTILLSFGSLFHHFS